MPIIALDEIHKTYGSGQTQVQALQGVSLRIEAGEFVAIMGASGSGKSTLMNILGCLDRPTRGRYLLDSEDTATRSKSELADIRSRKIGFVFQNFNLLSRTSALENVELPLIYQPESLGFREIQERARAALETVGLADRAAHAPNELSGGQQQRVAIARALVNRPRILLADEPTGNLDSRTSIEIMDVFQRLNDENLTIVMITHEVDICRYARRRIGVRDGRIFQDLPIRDRIMADEAKKRLAENQFPEGERRL